jgi:endonuclease/exonuclease/phosphatase family metal-dependent hydrolase
MCFSRNSLIFLKLIRRGVFSGLLFFLLLPFAHATVLLNDSFSYPDGAITNVSGGVWIEHSGGAPCQVVSGQAQVSSTAAEDVHAVLAGQPFSSGALYASFTVKCTALPTSGGAYFAHFNSSSFRCVVWASTANAAAGMFRLGIGNTNGVIATSTQLAVDLSVNTSYFVVVRYDVASGQSTLWLNPVNETDPGVAAPGSAASTTISSFSLRQTSGMGTMLLDNLTVATTFAEATGNQVNVAPFITTQPQDQIATVGDNVSFGVVAGGTAPFSYQWSSNNVSVPDATNDTFTLFGVGTNLNGSTYSVTVTNIAGATNSQMATLTVSPSTAALTYLDYNVDGNSITGTDPTNWAVAAPQVQAIGREIIYLNPDIIAFNEIPSAYKYQMTNWVTAFMPGFYLATNSVGDGFIQNYIASRWPITRSQSWLSASNLANFGYTNGSSSFTRDLFEAQIAVPGFSQPLHVFVAHLKATTSGGQNDADRRAAEASCISNFFVTTFLTSTNKWHPYIMSGDLNEDIFRPETNVYVTGQPIQRLISAPTGLQFTSPTNPFTGAPTNDMTESIRDSHLTVRFDYIMPNPLMFSNIVGSQIFRTDKLFPVPPNLNSNDDRIASDHLPVVMVFKNPFQNPFQLLSVTRSNLSLSLNWQSVPGQIYAVESSLDLLNWTAFATNLMATNFSATLTTNTPASSQFFRVRKAP